MDRSKLFDDEPGIASTGAMAADEEMSAASEEEIAELAYQYWEARGERGGSPWEDWFRAEQELKQRRAD